ncbi:hypothetical protein [Bradyrhizobium uaiense]|uniref:Uncharacterized protein n=1 Tax=Bradyrhizobium uaiense TaxID=2594946 RepID=A0A6P1BB78_9BRAD|nr:hypothetical protein [Bradyrhizobium uaiense]NEU95589.1 hypothetical protein [Bradyrhizobium uaiense]
MRAADNGQFVTTDLAKLSGMEDCSIRFWPRLHLLAQRLIPSLWTRARVNGAEVRMHLLGAMDGVENAMTNDSSIAFAYVHER